MSKKTPASAGKAASKNGKASKAKTAEKASRLAVAAITHDESKRTNIPTAEFESVMRKTDASPMRVAFERRNRDLDPQLVWRGKDERHWSDLVVYTPPIYIQEKVHPKTLINDLVRQTREARVETIPPQTDLFMEFDGTPKTFDKTEFYHHDQNWTNRMILGDSLQVMASLAEREKLRGQVQCIYIDPPYGIKFNSNFQWSTTSRDVKDGNVGHITREPEQVKAFRDTWRDGINSYLTYLRDRLTVARDLLTESGSIFVQIGDENVHRVRALMDEVFGEENFVSQITSKTTGGLGSSGLKSVSDYILWYARAVDRLTFRKPLTFKLQGEGASTGERYNAAYDCEAGTYRQLSSTERGDPLTIARTLATFRYDNLVSSGYTVTCTFPLSFEGQIFSPGGGRSWKTNAGGVERLTRAGRIGCTGKSVQYRRFLADYPCFELNNIWSDNAVRTDKQYVVETAFGAIQRCILMTTDPGDLVLDPTCGSGTTATVAEQWGRRWITIDTSRVALALARARIMGAKYPFFLLADSREGQVKEADVSRNPVASRPTHGNIRHGFVYERVPHITLKSIANNAEIDVIWDTWQQKLEPLREKLNAALKTKYEEWDIPRDAEDKWPDAAKKAHAAWWEARIGRQKEIDASIAAKAEFEYLYDKPYVDKSKVRVAGPFTVESLSPHRELGVDEDGDVFDPHKKPGGEACKSFADMVLENLRAAGVQQAHKEGRITFTSLTPWPGRYLCAEGRYMEGDKERRAAIFIGPEFGTTQRTDLVAAAREAGEGDFDVLIACAFNYEAHTTEFASLGRIPVLKARMNADLHMSDDLKNTGKGNLFVVFGEPDITLLPGPQNTLRVKVNGVDVFHPITGKIESSNADGIACWFVDTDYNEESFFVRHAYFLGAQDPYDSLKRTLKAEIDEDAWGSLHSDTSRPFRKPSTGRIAVKVINHLGDEVMKVFKVE